MKNQFRIINRTTGEEQVFNSDELQRFFYCEYDPQTQKIKYNISHVKPLKETLGETIGLSCLGLAIVILATKIIMSWI